MRKNLVVIYLMSIFTLFVFFYPKAYAGLLLDKTRIIWNESSLQEVITLKNNGNDIYLIQADVYDTPTVQKKSDYFIATPPLYRLNANSQQTMKIIPEDKIKELPKDRESMFYFSAIGIPGVESKNNEKEVAKLSIGTRLIIKLFYRPDGLTQSSDEAAKSLIFSKQKNNLCIENPSEYFITLSSFDIDGKKYDQAMGFMISPKSKASLAVQAKLTGSEKASWTVINDYGGDSGSYSATISPSKEVKCQ